MISQMQASEQPRGLRATEGHNEAGARLYPVIPDRVDHVPHPDYLCPDTERELFGPEAPVISVPQWRPSPEFEDAQQEADQPQAKNLSRQDEAILFRRYNCARYHLANLMEKQMRRFARGRVPEILAWYRRVLENQAVLVEGNMALVVCMAKRTRIDSVEFGELVSEGNMALLRAVDKFDFSRGFKFSTYACSAILKAFSRLAISAGTHRQRFASNSEPEWERSDELDRRHSDHRELALDDLRQALILNHAGLTDIERTVLGARFAVVGHDRVHTLKEVSGLVRLSSERVRQVQNGALTKLRRALERTIYHPTSRSGKTNGAFENLTTTFSGRLGVGVPIAAGCGT